MMIEATGDELPPLPTGERVAGAKRRSGEGAANHAFVILGRSRREAASADPRIHAVTPTEGCKRLRIPAKLSDAQGAMLRTVAERECNGMDPRVYAASLRSLLRPRMTKAWWVARVAQNARLSGEAR